MYTIFKIVGHSKVSVFEQVSSIEDGIEMIKDRTNVNAVFGEHDGDNYDLLTPRGEQFAIERK